MPRPRGRPGGRDDLLFGLHGARPGDEGNVIPAHLHARCDRHDRVVGMPLARRFL